MMAGAGATGRGPASAALGAWTTVRRVGVRDATAPTRLSGPLPGRCAPGCAALARRCLCRAGTVLAKPVAARRWRAKMRALIGEALAMWDLIIVCTRSEEHTAELQS